jgi:hypothetical protein
MITSSTAIISSTTLEALIAALPELELEGKRPSNGPAHNNNSDDLGNGAGPESSSGAGGPTPDAVDIAYRMLPPQWQKRIAAPMPPDSDRSRMFARIVGYFRTKHSGVSIDIIEQLFKRFPQGPASKYQGRLRAEIDRIYNKISKREVHRRIEHDERGDKPIVRLIVGMIAEKLDEAEAYLLDTGDQHQLYRRGDFIVLPALEEVKLADGTIAKRPGTVRITPLRLRELWTKRVDFQIYKADKDDYVSIDCPHEFARHYLDRVREWRLPALKAFINTPFLRADGTIVQTPGYDQVSGVLYDPMGTKFPPVPEYPDKEEALRALRLLKEPIADFPFVPDRSENGQPVPLDEELECKSASRSVSLSEILTALRRPTLPQAPLHAHNAPQAATGKTKLVHITSIISCGFPAIPFSPGLTEEEFEKRLSGELLSGAQIILLDNCEAVLEGMLLAQCLSEPFVKVRVLGTNDNPTIPMTALLTATGNNLQLGGDTPRRSLRSDLDAQMDAPETREFTEDAVDIARRRRPELVIAGLTILRAWHLAREKEKISGLSRPLGNYEIWSREVRDALIWLGESDPVSTQALIRGADPSLAALKAVMGQWEKHFGTEDRYSVTEIIARAVGHPGARDKRQGNLSFDETAKKEPCDGIPELRETLLNVAGRNGAINGCVLGRWLGHVAKRVVDGRRFDKNGIIAGVQYWRLFQTTESPP